MKIQRDATDVDLGSGSGAVGGEVTGSWKWGVQGEITFPFLSPSREGVFRPWRWHSATFLWLALFEIFTGNPVSHFAGSYC